MDRHRGGDRYGNNPNDSHSYRHPRGRGDTPINRHRGGFAGNRRPFDGSSPRYSLSGDGGGGGGGFRPIDGDGEFRQLGLGRNFDNNASSEFEVPISGQKRFNPDYEVPMPGQKRQFPFSPERFSGGSFEKRNFDGDNFDKRHVDGGNFDKKQPEGGSFAKLFVGSVPKTATEDDIRPAFEEHGNVVEVALIKDKRTGQQQGNTMFTHAGCCFIKYATSEEADRAIHALHNQYTLPGGVAPIQVRYADGERERLVEYKLFVGSLNKQATEKDIEEIFMPYGRVQDVYLMRDEMKQSRGCGFVKFTNKDVAMAAINALNGIYRMRGCEQPMIVRFADPKRPRPGETRDAPAFGGPGFGPRLQSPGIRPPNLGEAMHASVPPNAWHPMSQQGMAQSDIGMHGFGGQVAPRPGDGKPSSAPSFNPPGGHNSSPLKKPNMSPQHFNQPGQLQAPPNSGGQTSFSQGFNGLPPQAQTGVSSTTTTLAVSNNLPPHLLTAMMNQYQMPGQMPGQQQSASSLAQMLSQQKQTLQASYQSSQQAFSQLQQQMQLMQPTNHNSTPQQNLQAAGFQLQQSTWAGGMPQTSAPSGGPTVKPVTDSVVPAGGSLKCNWTEHTSPDGYKYYYNSTTGESKWEKPEELTLFELQQKPPQQQTQPQAASMQQSQSQPNSQPLPGQQTQIPQFQLQSQLQMQMQAQGRHPQQLPHTIQPSAYQTTGIPGHQNIQGYGNAHMPVAGGSMNDTARFQQGMQEAQDWAWKNKSAGPGS